MKRTLLSFILLFCVFSFDDLFAQNPNFNYTQTCFGNQTTLVASSSLPDLSIASWLWDLDGNGTYEKSGKTIISLLTQDDTIAVKLKITPNTGTADSVTKNVIIDPLPQVNFFASNLCQGKTATYISQSMIAPGNITQYKWDFNNDGVDDAFGPTDTIANYVCGPAATYVTKLTCVSDKQCSAFSQKITTVYANPTAVFSTSNTCVNANAVFNNTSTTSNLDFYKWTFGDGNQSTTSGDATHSYSTSGTYTVTLIAATQNGCRDTTTQQISVNPNPVVNFSNPPVCLGDVTNFIDLSTSNTPIVIWNWNFDDGSLNSTAQSPAHTYTTSGNYSSVLVATDQLGCKDSMVKTTAVSPLPIVAITTNGNTILHSGSSVQLIANGANSYLWSTNAVSNNITVNSIGTYVVTGTDLNNCKSSDSIMITIENSDTVSVTSNILTPNEDGINDELNVFNITAYLNCELNVYNMWNDNVYSQGINKDKGWKGTNNSGVNLPAGPYYYIIKCDDKPQLKGNINILR